MFVYDSAIRVPLILWRPGLLPAGRVVREPVRLTDLAPTLLDLVGAPPLKTAHGRSLRPLIDGGTRGPPPPDLRRDAHAAALHELGAAAGRSATSGGSSSTRRSRSSTTWRADPAETRNLHDERPQTVRGLRAGTRDS